MRKSLAAAGLCIVSVALSACGHYNAPSLSGNPATMSSDTLCYRYATAKRDQAIADEITRRNLNCARVLENDRLYQRR